MTKPGASAEITCPSCGESSTFESYDSINVTLNPELKEKLLSGELTKFKCPSCGFEADVSYDFLYHDMTHGFMVQLSTDDEDASKAIDAFNRIRKDLLGNLFDGKYRFRLVRNRNQLIEKIHLFEDGLNDKAMEICKLIALSGLRSQGEEIPDYEDLLYVDTSEDGEEISLEFVGTSPASVSFPMETYTAVESGNFDLEDSDEGIEVVNVDWALKAFASMMSPDE